MGVRYQRDSFQLIQMWRIYLLEILLSMGCFLMQLTATKKRTRRFSAIATAPHAHHMSGLEVVEDTHMSNLHTYTIAYLEDRIPSVARQLDCDQADISHILDTIEGHDEETVLEAVELLGADLQVVQDYLSMDSDKIDWSYSEAV